MRNSNPISQTLLDVGLSLLDPEYGRALRFDTQGALHSLKRDFSDWKLSITDWKITCALFAKQIMGEKYLSATDLLGGIFGAPRAILCNLSRLVRLLDAGIIEARNLQGENDEEKSGANRGHSQCERNGKSIAQADVLEMQLSLSARSLRRFLGDEAPARSAVQPYQDNEEYLRDWFQYVDLYREYRKRKSFNSSEAMRMEQAELKQWEKRLARRCSSSKKTFPLQELVQSHQLEWVEQIILVYVLKKNLDGNACPRDEVLDLISEDEYDQQQKARYFDPGSRLLRNGLIEVLQFRIFDTLFAELKLGPGVSNRILKENHSGEDAQKVDDIIGSSDLVKLEDPMEDFSRLILPESIKKTLLMAMGECRRDIGGILRSWGFGTYSSGHEADFCKPSRLMLFYGRPGTGKTFAARAFARELGKQLLVTDVSRLLSCWVGESEANVSRLFSLYEQIALRVENPPILLLNECDQFLTQRGYADRSVDRMYNQMQNLFLEAFERFQGILIATTNLRDNLDPAFSRRFHLKLEFPMPDPESRLRLWRIHIPSALPLAQDVNLPALAQEYALTGGQIAVIVKNAALEAAQIGDQNRGVSMDLLRKYIQIELSSSFCGGSKHSWGFSLPSQRMKYQVNCQEAI